MSAQNHETERLHRRIRQLQLEYKELENQKEFSYKVLLEQLENSQKRIAELESNYIKMFTSNKN
jgi:hypothetical protein